MNNVKLNSIIKKRK